LLGTLHLLNRSPLGSVIRATLFIESFNGSFRDECLNVNWFLSLDDAKEKIEAFKDDYNGFRPHSALRGLTPNQVLDRHLQDPDFSNLGWR